MDLVTGSQIERPLSVENCDEAKSLMKTNSIWTKFLAFIGAHDFLSQEVIIKY